MYMTISSITNNYVHATYILKKKTDVYIIVVLTQRILKKKMYICTIRASFLFD